MTEDYQQQKCRSRITYAVPGTHGGTSPEAAPPPSLGPLDQPRAEGIAFDVPAHCQEMAVILNRKGFEPTLIQVASTGRMAMGMPPLRVGHGEPAHELRQVPVLSRPDHQMKMVGHHAIGQQPHVIPRHRLADCPLEGRVIVLVTEDRQPRIGAIQRVVNQPSLGSSRWSTHAVSLPRTAHRVRNRLLTPYLFASQELVS